MAVAGGSETKGLELSLNKATNPLNNAEEWEEIQRFCSEVNKELEGPQYATRLLSHKIQSPQEWEAMQGLTVLEVCMRNCGARFHAEVGKYRFLNELIKVLSPKYLGARSTAKVKNKIVELMYSWTVGIANETKIQDAYKMLKRQGVIQQDPKLTDNNQGYFLPPPPPPRPSNPLFEDEEKSKLLSRLLKSGHPDDLDAANRLIKTMVKEDQTRMEKITKRIGALKSVEECTHTLSEMVARHRHVKATTEEFDSMKEVYKKCERLRPTLFKLASDTDDNDDALADILRANDGLTSVMEFYKSTVEGQTINGDVQQSVSGGGASLLDLEGLEVSSSVPIPSAIQLDTELMGLGLNDPLVGSPVTEVFGSLENSAAQMSPATESEPSRAQIGSLAELEQIGRNMLQKSIPACTSPVTWSSPPIKLTLRELQSKGESHSPSHSTTLVSTPAMASPGKATADISLANVFVPLESIKPSSSLPVTAYDGHGLRVLLHFAREPPLGRSDVLVVVLSLLSTAPLPVQRLLFQAAVPKSMRVKLQPPSGTELPPFNPLVPPSAITQVMLLANPNKEKVRLRYKLTFLLGEESYSEVGEVDSFPVKCDEG